MSFFRSYLAPLTLTLALLQSLACATPTSMTGPRTSSFPRSAPTRTVLFIHGMYITPSAWQPWQAYFEKRGYRTSAPDWPAHTGSAAEQRADPRNKRLAALTLEQVIAHYRALVEQLDEPPILIGHSMGGLVVQALLAQGLGAAGIAIDSAPPKGVISLKYSFLKSNWPVISPFADLDEPIALSFADFQYAFGNTLSVSAQKQAYQRYIVPESRRVGKGPTTSAGKIPFDKARAPLLLIAGSEDRVIPASLVREIYDRYEDAPGITDYQEFPARSHWIVSEPGWEQIASYTLAWVERQR